MLPLCFDHLFFAIGGKGIPSLGFWDGLTRNTRHQADETNSSFLVIYAHSLKEEAHAGSHRGWIKEQNEQPGATGGSLCSVKSVGHLLAPMAGCDWLV